MWLPGPLYESMPYCYLLGGSLFITGTLYIGIDAPGSMLYVGCGLISIAAGVVVLMRRQTCRMENNQPENVGIA
jgi:hypothetical protein